MAGVIPSSEAWKRTSRVVRANERAPIAASGAERKKVFGGGSAWFKITAATQDGTNKRWAYTAKRQVKTSTSWAGWADSSSDTDDYTLRNTIEAGNGATGTYGNGISSSNFTGTFALIPIGVGAIVRAWTVSAGGTIEWWFEAVNQVDGSC